MKRILIALLLCFCAFVATVKAALPATESCAGTGTMSGSWTQLTTYLIQRSGDICVGSGTFATHIWNADAFPDNQYGQITFTEVSDGFAGAGVRVTEIGTDHYTGYFLYCGNNDTCTVQKCTDFGPSCEVIGVYSEIGATNEVWKIGIAGNRIYIFEDAVEITCDTGVGCSAGVLTDNAYTTGSATISTYSNGSGYNWEAGAFSAPDGGASSNNRLSLLGVGE